MEPEAIAALVCREIGGYTSQDELTWLASVACEIPADLWVVEIGVWTGRSLAALSLARDSLRVAGVDHFRGSDEHQDWTVVKEGRLLEVCQANLARVGARPELLPVSSVRAAEKFRGQVGMLFIDGSHDYNSVRDDLCAWLPKMVSGGLLAVHDYHPPRDHPWSGFPGVARAVDELCPEADFEALVGPEVGEWSIWAGVRL